jgi:hypothetical protein
MILQRIEDHLIATPGGEMALANDLVGDCLHRAGLLVLCGVTQRWGASGR